MSDLARHLWRFPTRAAQDSLACRFNLSNEDWMQDWEYVVSDSNRVDEYLAAYESGELSDDEKFSLMEIMVDAFDGSDGLLTSLRFQSTLHLIETNLALHLYTVWYFASMDSTLENAFAIAPWMRELIARHPTQFELEPSETLESHEI